MRRDEFLPEWLVLSLPGLGSQAGVVEPLTFAHYCVPDHPFSFYVTEGGFCRGAYVLFGFVVGSAAEEDWRWGSYRVGLLERIVGVVRDAGFVPGLLTDVVVLPYNDEYPSTLPLAWHRIRQRLGTRLKAFLPRTKIRYVNGKNHLSEAFRRLQAKGLVRHHNVRYHPLLAVSVEVFAFLRLERSEAAHVLERLTRLNELRQGRKRSGSKCCPNERCLSVYCPRGRVKRRNETLLEGLVSCGKHVRRGVALGL